LLIPKEWEIIYCLCKFNAAFDLIYAAKVLKKEPQKKKCLSCLSRNEVLCLKNKLLIESINDSTPYGRDMSYYQREIDAQAIQE